MSIPKLARLLTFTQKVGNRPALDILYPNSDNPSTEDAEIEYVLQYNKSCYYYANRF